LLFQHSRKLRAIIPIPSPPFRPLQLTWPPLVIGHRGAAAEAPENTLLAFELALQQGADGIEFDVHLAADGVPVVIHDASLRRTTSGRGLVRAFTSLQLCRLDAGSWFNKKYPKLARPSYAGCRIPFLEDVLKWVVKNQCRAYLEIKERRRLCPGMGQAVLKLVHARGAARHTTIISFDFEMLRAVREIDSSMAIGLDFTHMLGAARKAARLSASCLLPQWKAATPGLIRKAHAESRQVLIWGLETKERIRKKIAAGADGIITNHPAAAASILAEFPSGQAGGKEGW
jgi:glycerophosphoryl diester phosphodiesterase